MTYRDHLEPPGDVDRLDTMDIRRHMTVSSPHRVRSYLESQRCPQPYDNRAETIEDWERERVENTIEIDGARWQEVRVEDNDDAWIRAEWPDTAELRKSR